MFLEILRDFMIPDKKQSEQSYNVEAVSYS